MIIALFALAVLMIVGGIAAVLQGFPYVRLESGLAMVIAGATVSAAGAVLLGIAVLATRLRSLEQALTGGRTLDAARETLPQRAMAATRANPRTVEPPFDAALLPTGPMGGAALAGLAASPSPPPTSEPVFGAAPEPPAGSAEPMLPDLLPSTDTPAEPPKQKPHEPEIDAPRRDSDDDIPVQATGAPEADPLSAPEPVAAQEVEAGPVALRPALDEAPLLDPAPEMPPAEPELQVVGTYASGGNTYVMYSNGSIEAETPRGRFSFNSLDELKAFVDAGGESESRGAA